MKISVKKTKAGLLLQATEKRNGKNVTRPLKGLPNLIAVSLRIHNSSEAHKQWLTSEVERLRKRYATRGEINEDDPINDVIACLVWDVVIPDHPAMETFVGQMNDWYEGFTKDNVKRPTAGGSEHERRP